MPDPSPLKLFIIYAREDQPALLELKAHLRPLEKIGHLTVWYDGEILPGEDWDETVKLQLFSADIILLFISKNFFNSDYIEGEELKKALDRHQKGDTIIVPIIIKPCIWDAHPQISGFQALPKDAKAVSSWSDHDEAWENVARGIMKITEQRGYEVQTHANLNYAFAQHIGETSMALLKRTEELSCNTYKITGVPSGFIDLDRITSGWQPSDLIIIGAPPGMGMTAFIVSIAINVAKDFGIPVAFFSLELNKMQLATRMVSMTSEIAGKKIRTGQMEDYEWQVLQDTTTSFSNIPIFIDDTLRINLFELRARCRQLMVQHDIKLIIIDYLQLLTSGSEDGSNTNRGQEMPQITRGLKNLARELDIPVIALLPMPPSSDSIGARKRPQLSDIRQFGTIEVDADMIAFIYRPEYYQMLEDENGQSLKGIAEFIIVKHSHGALGTVRLKFSEEFAHFHNLENDNQSDIDFYKPRVISRSSRMDDEDIPF